MQPQPGSIVVEADIPSGPGDGIGIGSLLPVQFVTESGHALPPITGTVVARSPLPQGPAARQRPPGVRVEILLRLRDLARNPGST